MDTVLVDLFNDGDNDGNIVIISAEKKEIRCHSHIVKERSTYFQQSNNLSRKKFKSDCSQQKKYLINLNQYNSKIITTALNIVYGEWIFINMTARELLEFIHLINFLEVTKREILEKELVILFMAQIDEKNWLDFFKTIFSEMKIYKKLMVPMTDFYTHRILTNHDLETIDPLNDLHPTSEIYQYLYETQRSVFISMHIMLNKISPETYNKMFK